jgi:putative transposase
VQKFVAWYNVKHLSQRVEYVTLGRRYNGQAEKVLVRRQAAYEQAKAKNPTRWSADTRNWQLASSVYCEIGQRTRA